MPDVGLLVTWGIISIVLLIVNYLIFKKLEKSFVEEGVTYE